MTANMTAMPRRSGNVRNFMTIWMVLTLLVGAVTFGAIYVATGSIGSGGDDNNNAVAVVEPNSEGESDVAQQVTATSVPLIAPPANATATPAASGSTDSGSGGVTPLIGPGSGGGGAVSQPAAATPSTPVPTPTIVPTINPPQINGTLPGLDDFILGAHILGDLNDRMFNAAKIAKMDWVKIQLRYERGVTNPDDWGWQIQLLNSQGLGVLFGVVGHPQDLLEEGYYADYAEFVGALAARGANGIEVWNEINLDREWPVGRIDPRMYTELLKVSYEAIKAANPNTMVISAGLAPTGAEGAFGLDHVWNDDRYYRGLAEAGAAEYMDCIGNHYNEGIISPTLNSGDPRQNDYPTRYLQAQTDRAYKPFADRGTPLPVCYTELGYLTSEGYGPLPDGFSWAADVSLQEQASWLGTAALVNAQSGKVRMMIIWNLDFTEYGSNPGDDPKAGYAIIRQNGACPACDTLGSLRP